MKVMPTRQAILDKIKSDYPDLSERRVAWTQTDLTGKIPLNEWTDAHAGACAVCSGQARFRSGGWLCDEHAPDVPARPDGATLTERWLADQQAKGKYDPEIQNYPAPVVTSRDGGAPEAPAPFAKLAGRAKGAGWAVRAQYAVGCIPHATTGRPGPARPSYALVATRTGQRLVAVYQGQSKGFKWESMWALMEGLPMRRMNTVAELEAMIDA